MAEIIRKTTIFTRNYCCICREKNVRIHRIKKESIVMAYIKFKIVIQRGTCCCERHLNNNGLIRDDQFELMPTFEKAFSSNNLFYFIHYIAINWCARNARIYWIPFTITIYFYFRALICIK